ncbi:hypothetical protein [Nocardiopsis sp. CNT312]|uniref:hypothetical protein n=1 Tax=Nocardiopsis sp. CNT312 TaxID=1137268 RepID=UPI0004915B4C|nr:hypothetical protein [Nocardiopsis sp. CNT312]
MPARTRDWFRAVTMFTAPVALFAVILYHPFLAHTTVTAEGLAEVIAADPTRWSLTHVLAVVALALLALAFQGLHDMLREAGEERWSSFGLPLVTVALVFLAALAGKEPAVAAVSQAGTDVLALVQATRPSTVVMFLVSAVTFLCGALAFAMGAMRTVITGRTMTALVVVALVVLGLAMLTPLFTIGYVIGAAAIVAFWPLAWAAVRGGPAAEAGPGEQDTPDGGERPAAPRPRAADRKGVFRHSGR